MKRFVAKKYIRCRARIVFAVEKMTTVDTPDSTQTRVSKQAVAKQFVRLYYSILNTHNGYLYQFYGKNSTVTVRETMREKETLTETAEEEQSVKTLLQSLYSDVSVKVDSAVPQFSVDDTVLLHVNGTMHRTSTDSKRAFTQAFVLCPQENGYYVRTDVTHVLSCGHRHPLLGYWGHDARTRVTSGVSEKSEASREVPLQIGSFQGGVPEDGVQDIRTATPPLEDAPLHKSASRESDPDPEELSTRKQPWIVRPKGAKTSSVTHSIAMPAAVVMAPPMAIPFVPPTSMAFPLAMPPRYMRQRSMSMGGDPWAVHTQMGHGVFIARLPFGVQPADVEEAFSAFGPILGGRDGIQVRDGRNGCYAFVTFENAESAHRAIQQGAVLQGKRVFIEPRFPRRDAEAAFVAFPPMMTQPVAPYHMPAPHHIPRMP